MTKEPASGKKAMTRERILDAAMPLFLEHGFSGVSIDQLMAAAKLTRGGFYAHFKSKEDLFAELLRRDYGLPKKLRQARLGELGPGIGPKDAMAYYLSPANRSEISSACPMVSQAADVRRAGESVRGAYEEHILSLHQELVQQTGDEKTAWETMAAVVGAVSIAGAVNDDALASKLLTVVSSDVLGKLK